MQSNDTILLLQVSNLIWKRKKNKIKRAQKKKLRKTTTENIKAKSEGKILSKKSRKKKNLTGMLLVLL